MRKNINCNPLLIKALAKFLDRELPKIKNLGYRSLSLKSNAEEVWLSFRSPDKEVREQFGIAFKESPFPCKITILEYFEERRIEHLGLTSEIKAYLEQRPNFRYLVFINFN